MFYDFVATKILHNVIFVYDTDLIEKSIFFVLFKNWRTIVVRDKRKHDGFPLPKKRPKILPEESAHQKFFDFPASPSRWLPREIMIAVDERIFAERYKCAFN